MTFDRPYDRSSTGTNAYSIAPAIAPAIGFDRPFDRVYPIPSHSYARSKRSPRPWVAASAALACKGRAGRGASRHVCSNTDAGCNRLNIIHARGWGDNRYSASFSSQRISHPPGWLEMPGNFGCGWIYPRLSPHSPHWVDHSGLHASSRNPAPATHIALAEDPAGVPVGPNEGAHAVIHVTPVARGPFEKIPAVLPAIIRSTCQQ